MVKLFNLKIITPEKIIYEGEITSAIVPAALGYLGILANHAPLVANLISGKIILKKESGELVILNSKTKGFLEILNNNVNIILNQGLIGT